MRPILFHAFGFGFGSARVFAGLAALASYLVFESRRKELALSDDDFWGLMGALALGTILGAIVFYAVAYGSGLAANLSYWRARRDIAGGSMLGAWAGAAAAAALFCRRKGKPFGPAADALGAAAPLGLAVMRFGCLLNGCCFGKPTTLPWGITFNVPSAVPQALRGKPLHPAQLYEAAAALLIFEAVRRCSHPRGPLASGRGLLLSAGLYGAARFAIDFLRGGDIGIIAPLGLSVAQWVCAAVALFAAARLARRKA